MQDLQRDINTALMLLEKGYLDEKKSTNYNQVFLKTNENLGRYFKYFPIKNGIVSTIIGSGDHVLQSIKDNPKEIHAFDKNIFSIYLVKLKIAACQTLNHKQFKEYFECNNINFLSKEYYKIIRETLDKKTKEFWDAMYTDDKILKRYSSFFVITTSSSNNELNSYETKKNYYKVKKNISKVNIKYYPLEFFEMFNNINENIKFDAIFLSNICDWYYSPRQKKQFLTYAKDKLTKQLSNNGMVAVYCIPKYLQKKSLIFENDIYKLESNGVIVYKKKL